MSLVNQDVNSAVLGSPCPKARQRWEGKRCSQVTFCDPNSEAAGSEGQENVSIRALLALLQNSHKLRKIRGICPCHHISYRFPRDFYTYLCLVRALLLSA